MGIVTYLIIGAVLVVAAGFFITETQTGRNLVSKQREAAHIQYQEKFGNAQRQLGEPVTV